MLKITIKQKQNIIPLNILNLQKGVVTEVHFNRLASRDFHDLFNSFLYFFSKGNEYRKKKKHTTFG